MLKPPSKPAPWVKPVIFINAVIAFAALCFFAGWRLAPCNISQINEVHYVSAKQTKVQCCIDFTVISFYQKKLADTLKQIKPPYSEEQLNKVINDLGPKMKLNKYFKVITADSTYYRILTSDDWGDYPSNFTMITPKETYFIKPLKIVHEEKAER
jgi:hypothetical protein